MDIPKAFPERGFYHHYKHDPSKGIAHYAYELLGIGCFTEDSIPEDDKLMAVYRPLYPTAFVYANGRMYDLRPLHMWNESVTVNGVIVPRFREVTDFTEIVRLRQVARSMYGNH